MKMPIAQWRQAILAAGTRRAFPLMSAVGPGLTGLRVCDVTNDGERQARCLQAVAARFPAAAAIVTVMDLSVEAEAFGCRIQAGEQEVPTVTGSIVADGTAAHALRVPAVGAGRTGAYLKAAAIASAAIPDRPVLGCQIGPFSLAGRLCDMNAICVRLIDEPDMVHTVLEKCTRFLIDYARAFKAAGAQGVVIAEPAAGLLSPAHCTAFSSAYVRRIVEAVQDEGFLVILHNCGRTLPLVPSMLSTGAHGLHFGNAVDLARILPQVPADILVLGNLDPVAVFRDGTPEEVTDKTHHLLETLSAYPNFVPSSGCDIPPGCPEGNLAAFLQAVADYLPADGRRAKYRRRP